MTLRRGLLVALSPSLLAAALLAGCGGGGNGASATGGAQVPAAVAGTWGADCAEPFVKFDGGQITVFPDQKTYALKSASLSGGQLTVSYDSAAGSVTEVYVQEGASLRLDHGNYGGADATWHKQPMNKCP
jgi:hypothetical protein